MGDDNMVVDNARVSFNKQAAEYTTEQNNKLIAYLAKHHHWTPFACCQIRLHVKVPIFLARQYFKHQVGSTKNEVSRRYVESEVEIWHPKAWRKRPTNSIKQGSGDCMDASISRIAYQRYKTAVDTAAEAYSSLLELGVCPEQARAILPQGMCTEFIDTGSLVYWARVYKQRSDATAQKEWQEVCEQINEIMVGLFPVSWPALIGGNDVSK
jgi:thymidylate synthase (FAD)